MIRRGGSPGRLLRAGLWAILLLGIAAPRISAQVLEIGGGGSSLLAAYGGSLELQSGDSVGRFDLGMLNHPEVGFSYTRPFHGFNLTAGDQNIPFVLPTDLFNQSYYFLGRGLRLEKRSDGTRLIVYAGTTSLGFKTSFLDVARSEKGVGLVFYERQLSSNVRFYSYNLFSSQQTSLQGIEWTPIVGMKLATTAGIGSNQGYWAESFDYKRDWIAIQGSYSKAGNAFKRVDVEAPLVAETTGPNLRVDLQPTQWLAINLGHQNYLNPAPGSSAGSSAGVDSLGISVIAAGIGIHGSAFHSQTRANDMNSLTFGAQRSFGRRFEAGVNYFQSHAGGSRWHSFATMLRETMTQKLSLTQNITESNGHTTLSVGGNFVSNRFTLGVEHETFFFPFAAAGQSPFRQALVLNVQIQLPHDVQLHGATTVDALGRLRYTSYANSYLYPHGNGPEDRGRFPSLPVYIVRGIVVDERAHPIRGAALEIDGQGVFTDSEGTFLVRLKKPKTCALEVLTDQFMFPGRYEIVSAPKTVRAETEEKAEPYKIVLKSETVPQPVLSAATASGSSRPSK